MAYGNIQGVQDMLVDYGDMITESLITTDMINRFLTKASNAIDGRISSIVTTPLTTVPGEIDDIANELAVCEVLKRLSIQKAPNKTDWVVRFCDGPLERIDDIIENNPGLLDADTTTEPLMLSNRKDEDREFTITRKTDGVTIGDEGTMEDW